MMPETPPTNDGFTITEEAPVGLATCYTYYAPITL